MRKIGILGGAFDPVHLGHLGLAVDALDQAGLDEVWLMPSAQSPLKDHGPKLNDVGRVSLLLAAIEDEPRLKLCRLELERGGVSYTFDTIQCLRERHEDARFSWIIGWDQACQLQRWSRIEELVHQVEFLVFGRPGEGNAGEIAPVEGLRHRVLHSRMLPISSTEIRRRLQDGISVTDLLPKAVERLIVAHNFYHS